MKNLTQSILGEKFIFDFRRAIFWPSEKNLIITDTHWGKAHFFQQHGVSLTEEVHEAELTRLASLIQEYEPNSLLVLGDLIHHEQSLTSSLIERIAQFRRDFDLPLLLMTGNHDRHTHFPTSWKIESSKSYEIGEFLFTHDLHSRSNLYQFCGHLHPVIRLGVGRSRLKLPIFHLNQKRCLVPAFSDLSGGYSLRLKKGETGIVVTDEGVEILN